MVSCFKNYETASEPCTTHTAVESTEESKTAAYISHSEALAKLCKDYKSHTVPLGSTVSLL